VTLTPTELRSNLYRIIDQVLDTGEPVEIVRRGRIVRIVADVPRFRMDEVSPHPDFIVGDPDELIHLDWSAEWKP
jgi:prevent-host-death family protein